MFSSSNPFVIFELKQEFNIDKKLVDQKQIDLLKVWHPDKATTKSQQLEFAQAAATIVEAYNTLINDYKRGEFLYRDLLVQQPHVTINERVIKPQILNLQFGLRARVAKLKEDFDFGKFLELSDELVALKEVAYSATVRAFEVQNLEAIYDAIVQLRFLEKLEEEIEVLSVSQTSF